jgi:class 3 adenylate cyclase
LRSLQLKFSVLLVSLLAVGCIGLALIATQHERRSLEAEVGKRATALAANLAGAAKESLLGAEQRDFDGELVLERIVAEAGAGEGVVAVRVLDRTGRVVSSLVPEEQGQPGPENPESDHGGIERLGKRLRATAPIFYSDVPIGSAQVELDLRVLVDPVIRSNTSQLAIATAAIAGLGIVAGVIFTALLVGPLRRLRAGVEALSRGELETRVPPTSRDEVGELTRAFNEMGDSLCQKQRIQNAFGRYVNDYVLNRLLEGPEEDPTTGMEREITILFADVRKFTRLSEGMKANDVVALLNEVFQLVSDAILSRGGTIDKFIGDSVMAYFGAPVSQSDHAQRAVAAANDILRAVRERNQRVRREGPPAQAVEIGIGVHTGVVVVGNIGSDRRTDFTAIGDAVNVAHRLEKLAKPGEILVSEAVQRRVRTTTRLRFEGERQLSGREEPVHVYAVIEEESGDAARRAGAG